MASSGQNRSTANSLLFSTSQWSKAATSRGFRGLYTWIRWASNWCFLNPHFISGFRGSVRTVHCTRQCSHCTNLLSCQFAVSKVTAQIVLDETTFISPWTIGESHPLNLVSFPTQYFITQSCSHVALCTHLGIKPLHLCCTPLGVS